MLKDGKKEDVSREPEQVKAFRDTWKDGIHSYLTYLRDRLMVARELLTESGSIFVQIGDENVHRVRALMDEVFGEENLVSPNRLPHHHRSSQRTPLLCLELHHLVCKAGWVLEVAVNLPGQNLPDHQSIRYIRSYRTLMVRAAE